MSDILDGDTPANGSWTMSVSYQRSNTLIETFANAVFLSTGEICIIQTNLTAFINFHLDE
jgi:hypothetical protein